MNSLHESNDVIDRSLAQIAAEPPTDGPGESVVGRTLAAIDRFPSGDSQHAWRRPAKIAALLLAAIGVAVILWSLASALQAQSAFADVLAASRAARTKSCRITIEGPGHPPITFSQLLKEPDLMRLEFADGQISIDNWHTATHIVLDAKNRTAVVSPLSGDRLTEGAFSVRSLEQLAHHDYQKLAVRKINGRTAVGFRFSRGDTTDDIWADAKTHQLILTEVSIINAGQTSRYRADDFRFDIPMEDSLFEVPAGYQVIKGMPVRNEVRRISPGATTQP